MINILLLLGFLSVPSEPVFNSIKIGSSTPFSDAAGTLTLQNVDAIDATTIATFNAALAIALTPWTENIDAGGFDLTDAGKLQMDSIEMIGTTRNIYGQAAASDVATVPLILKGQDAYSQATGTNDNPGVSMIASGIPQQYFQCVSNTSSVRLYINAGSTTGPHYYYFDSGVDFAYGSDDTPTQLAVTATNVANAINGTATLNTLVTALASTVYVYLTPTPGLTTHLSISESNPAKINAIQGDVGEIDLSFSGFNNVGFESRTNHFRLRPSSVDSTGAIELYYWRSDTDTWGSTAGIHGSRFGAGVTTLTYYAQTGITIESSAVYSIKAARSSAGNDNLRLSFGGNAAGEYLTIGSDVLTSAGGNLSSIVFSTDVDNTNEIKHHFRLDGSYGQVTGTKTLAAAATTFAVDSGFMVITGDAGTNTVATITNGVSGQRLLLLFVDALVTITDTDVHTANTVDLSAAFTSADDTTLELIFDGVSFYEISRSTN